MSDVNEILGVKSDVIEEVKNTVTTSENKIGSTIKMLGKVTLGLGIFIGFIIGMTLSVPDPDFSSLSNPNPLRWVYGLTIIISSFISGITFIGFGEVVILLDKIKNNTY